MPQLTSEGTDLELGEHPRFENRWRGIQRTVFTAMIVMVAGGLLGVFGAGPLAASRTRLNVSSATLEYQRFARVEANDQMIVQPRGASGGRLLVHVDQTLVDAMGIARGSPTPMATASDETGTLYVFALAPGANGPIVFKAKPTRPGLARGIVSVDGEARTISQIVWP